MEKLELKGFYKAYNRSCVFDNTDCCFMNGRISLIMGTNGSGKTTFSKCVCGLENYKGNITFEGNDNSREKLLAIWDDTPFYSNLNGFDNLKVLCDKKLSNEEIFETAKKYMTIKLLNKKVRRYSYGQKKKLSIVLAELIDPQILIMDEITNGLDRKSLKVLKKYLIKKRPDRITILTGHSLGFYNDLIDDLYIIKDNKIQMKYTDYNSLENNLEEIYDSEFDEE
jgi:ABC-type multidrug transport system, ATPase component